jgi:hypothetical protein
MTCSNQNKLLMLHFKVTYHHMGVNAIISRYKATDRLATVDGVSRSWATSDSAATELMSKSSRNNKLLILTIEYGRTDGRCSCGQGDNGGHDPFG